MQTWCFADTCAVDTEELSIYQLQESGVVNGDGCTLANITYSNAYGTHCTQLSFRVSVRNEVFVKA
jgi:hypothetical protein